MRYRALALLYLFNGNQRRCHEKRLAIDNTTYRALIVFSSTTSRFFGKKDLSTQLSYYTHHRDIRGGTKAFHLCRATVFPPSAIAEPLFRGGILLQLAMISKPS